MKIILSISQILIDIYEDWKKESNYDIDKVINKSLEEIKNIKKKE